jgi:hypothetical protein
MHSPYQKPEAILKKFSVFSKYGINLQVENATLVWSGKMRRWAPSYPAWLLVAGVVTVGALVLRGTAGEIPAHPGLSSSQKQLVHKWFYAT